MHGSKARAEGEWEREREREREREGLGDDLLVALEALRVSHGRDGGAEGAGKTDNQQARAMQTSDGGAWSTKAGDAAPQPGFTLSGLNPYAQEYAWLSSEAAAAAAATGGSSRARESAAASGFNSSAEGYLFPPVRSSSASLPPHSSALHPQLAGGSLSPLGASAAAFMQHQQQQQQLTGSMAYQEESGRGGRMVVGAAGASPRGPVWEENSGSRSAARSTPWALAPAEAAALVAPPAFSSAIPSHAPSSSAPTNSLPCFVCADHPAAVPVAVSAPVKRQLV